MFTAIAHRYDLFTGLMSFHQDKFWRKIAARESGLAPGGYGLDVCCGTAMLTIELAKNVSSGRVVGLDFCENMLAKAVENIAKTPYGPNIELVQGNAMALPFADNTFDCATIGFALRNVPDISRTLAEMRRVVKSGGRVVSLELAKPSAPVFKQLYYFYFERIMPFLGKLGVGCEGPFQWLPESLRRFPHQREVCDIFRSIGLKDVHYHELTGGIVAVHVGIK